jgi:hypothetical protein
MALMKIFIEGVDMRDLEESRANDWKKISAGGFFG